MKETALTKTESFFAMLAFLAKIDTFFRFFPFIRSFQLPYEYTVILSCYDGASHCSHDFSFKNQLLLTLYQTTKFCFNPFPNKPWFLRVCSISPWKTLREKEKLLVTSNFSFSHCVFCPFQKLSAIFIKLEIVVCKLFQLGRVQNLLFGKELIG